MGELCKSCCLWIAILGGIGSAILIFYLKKRKGKGRKDGAKQ